MDCSQEMATIKCASIFYNIIPLILRVLRDDCCLFLCQIIYVMRNPKDNIVSYYHFSNVWADVETPKSFEHFLENYLTGKGEIPQSPGPDDQIT